MAVKKALPGGDIVEIPTNPQERIKLQKYVLENYGVDILERNIGEQIGEAAKAVPRGALTTLLDAPLGVASVIDIGDDSDVVAGLRALKKGIREDSPLAVNPVYSDDLSTKFGEGLGSFFPFLGAGKIGQTLQAGRPMAPGFRGYLQSPSFLAPAALAVPTGFSAQAERVQESRDMGEDVSGFQETLATLFGGVGGASEVLPITALFKRIPKSALQDETVKQMLARRLGSAARGGFAEGLQETAAGIYQDLVARGIYSDNLPIGASAYDDFTIGGLVGGTVDLVATSMADRRNRAAGNYIKTDADKAEQNKQNAKTKSQQDRSIIPVPVDVGPAPQYSFTQNTDGTFSVIDIADPTNPIEQVKTEAEALSRIDQIYTEYDLNKSKQLIDNLLYIKGLTQSSVAGEVAQKQVDTNLNSIDLKAIASYDSQFKDKNIAELQKGKSQTAKRYNLNNEGIKNRYSFAEAQQILNPVDFAKLTDTYTDIIYENTISRNPNAELPINFRNQTPLFNNAQQVAAKKNIILNNNDTINRFIKNLTGANSFDSATPAQKRLFIAHLNDLGTFNEETSFPDFQPRNYQAEDVSKFVTEFIDTPFTKGVVESRFGKEADAFISDLVESGRAVAEGNTYTINKNFELDIARKAEGFNETPEAFRDRLTAEGILPTETIEKLYNQEKSKQAFMQQAGYKIQSPFKARDTRRLRVPERKLGAQDRPGVYDSNTLAQDKKEQDRQDILNILRISRTRKESEPDIKDTVDFMEKFVTELPKDYRVIGDKVLAALQRMRNAGYTFDISAVSWKTRGGQTNRLYTSGFAASTAGYMDPNRIVTDKYIPVGINDMPSTRKGFENISSLNGVNYETVLHELIHAATVAQLDYVRRGNGNVKEKANYKRYNKLREESLAELKARYKEYKDGVRTREQLKEEPEFFRRYVLARDYSPAAAKKRYDDYFFNEYEFITWGTTNRGFQNFLQSQKSKIKPQKSLWSDFVNTIRNFLNLPANQDTMLSRLLRASEDVLDLPIPSSGVLPVTKREIFSTDYGLIKGKRAPPNNTSEKAKLDAAVQEATEINEKTVVGGVPVYNTAASDVAIKAAVDFNNDPSAKVSEEFIDEGSTGTIPDSDLRSRVNATMGKKVTNKSISEQVLNFMESPFTNIRKWFKDFRTNFIDSYDSIVKATKDQVARNKLIEELESNAVSSAIKTIRLAEKYRAIFKQMLTIGHVRSKVTDEQGNETDASTNVTDTEIKTVYNPGFEGDTGTGGFMQIIAPLYLDNKVDKERIWGYYERVKRDEVIKNRRNPDGTLSNPDYTSPFNEKDIANIRKIEQQYPEIVEVSENYQAWNNSLVNFAQEKGLLNREQAERWIAESSYFPFYREMVEDTGVKGPRIAVGALPNNPLNIKLKGGESEINSDPVESVLRNSMSILAASMKNDGVSKLIRNFEINGQARRIDKKEAVGNPNVIFAFKDGQKEFYEVDDIDLFNSLENFGGITMDPLVNFISMPSRFLRETVTRDPGFIAVNILRDTLSSAVTSGSDFVPIIDSVANMFGDISQLERFGVISGYDFANDEGDVKNFLMKEFRKQGINPNNSMMPQNLLFKVWDGLGDLTTKSDGATRKAVYDDVYKKLKEAGKTEGEAQSEASYQALEIINFGRRGNSVLWKIITSGIPFLNARVQGLDVLYRGFTGQYSAIEGTYKDMTQDEIKSEIQKKALMRGAFLTALTGVYYMLMSDREEYKNLRREVRDDNWIIPTPFDYSVKIPIPFEVGMLFKAIPERFFDMTMGEEAFTRPAVDDFLTSTARQAKTSLNLPFFQPGAGIQILKPFTEAFITNRNTYTGQEIVPYYKQGLLPAYQSTERTNELARVLGEAFNISPAKLEHAARGYTGTIGSYILMLADLATRQATGSPSLPSNMRLVPVFNRLLKDSDRSGGGLQQQFYELRSEVNEAVQTMNKLQQEGRLDELAAYRADMMGVENVKESVRRIEKYLTDWRERRRKLLQSNINASLKAELLQQLEFERDQRLAMIKVLRKQANVPVTQFFN